MGKKIVNMWALSPTKAAEEGRRCVIVPPEGYEMEVELAFIVKGSTSKEFKKKSMEFQNKMRKGISVAADGKIKDIEMSMEMDQESRVAYAYCVMDWENIVDEEGKKLPCEIENVLMIFDRFPWIEKQVDEYIRNIDNFFEV